MPRTEGLFRPRIARVLTDRERRAMRAIEGVRAIKGAVPKRGGGT